MCFNLFLLTEPIDPYSKFSPAQDGDVQLHIIHLIKRLKSGRWAGEKDKPYSTSTHERAELFKTATPKPCRKYRKTLWLMALKIAICEVSKMIYLCNNRFVLDVIIIWMRFESYLMGVK